MLERNVNNMNDKAKALKNKITGAVGKAIASPVVAYHNSKSRGYDRQYKAVKQYNDMQKSGVSNPRVTAAYQAVKDARSK